MSNTDVFLYCFSLVLYGFSLGMLLSWLLTMRRQCYHDEYVTRKKGDRDDA
jgi:hypothetical protein